MTHVTSVPTIRVVGGIDTHQDLHMAAVVDRDDGRLADRHLRGHLDHLRRRYAADSYGIGAGSHNETRAVRAGC